MMKIVKILDKGFQYMFPPFTLETSPLSLLRVSDQGIVRRFKKIDESLLESIQALGILPGISITLEQRFPQLIVKIGEKLIEIPPEIARVIHVKLHRTS